MYLNPNKKNCLTNVLLFARRCCKFGFWPCSFAEFSMIHTAYCISYSVGTSHYQDVNCIIGPCLDYVHNYLNGLESLKTCSHGIVWAGYNIHVNEKTKKLATEIYFLKDG
jgi:hypothetical protein